MDPTTFQDGGPDLGPKWPKVVRRITYDMHNGAVIDDIQPKGMKIDDLTGPIRGSRTNGRDIITEFHFRRGAWAPSDSKVGVDAATPTDVEEATADHAELTPSAEPAFSDYVLRAQAAMGCPLSPSQNRQQQPSGPCGAQQPASGLGAAAGSTPCTTSSSIGRLPLLPPALAAQITSEHREKIPIDTPLPFNAMVARPVGQKERYSTPGALKAVAKEWQRLRTT